MRATFKPLGTNFASLHKGKAALYNTVYNIMFSIAHVSALNCTLRQKLTSNGFVIVLLRHVDSVTK